MEYAKQVKNVHFLLGREFYGHNSYKQHFFMCGLAWLFISARILDDVDATCVNKIMQPVSWIKSKLRARIRVTLSFVNKQLGLAHLRFDISWFDCCSQLSCSVNKQLTLYVAGPCFNTATDSWIFCKKKDANTRCRYTLRSRADATLRLLVRSRNLRGL